MKTTVRMAIWGICANACLSLAVSSETVARVFVQSGQEVLENLSWNGILVDEQEAHVGGAKIEMRRGVWGPTWANLGSKVEATAISAMDGSFQISQPKQGACRVLVTKQGYAPIALDLNRQSFPSHQPIVMRHSAEVSGEVMGADGKAVKDVVVFARLFNDDAVTPRPVAGWDKSSWEGLISNGDRFMIEGLPMGLPIRIWAAQERNVPQPITSLTINSEPLQSIRVILAEGARVHGTVSERLQPGDVVWIKEASMDTFPFAPAGVPVVAKTFLDDAGHYSFDGVCDGQWVVGYGTAMGEYASSVQLRCSLVTVETSKKDGKNVRLDFQAP